MYKELREITMQRRILLKVSVIGAFTLEVRHRCVMKVGTYKVHLLVPWPRASILRVPVLYPRLVVYLLYHRYRE